MASFGPELRSRDFDILNVKSSNRRKQLEITDLFGTMEPDADYDYKNGRVR
jgi:hypothetical protein